MAIDEESQNTEINLVELSGVIFVMILIITGIMAIDRYMDISISYDWYIKKDIIYRAYYYDDIGYYAIISMVSGLIGWIYYFTLIRTLDKPICPSCHKKIEQKWISCPYCGYILKTDTENIIFNDPKKELDEDYIENRISREEYLKKKKI